MYHSAAPSPCQDPERGKAASAPSCEADMLPSADPWKGAYPFERLRRSFHFFPIFPVYRNISGYSPMAAKEASP